MFSKLTLLFHRKSTKMDIKPDLTTLRDAAGTAKYTREFPPAHFTIKVQSFSNSREEKYESGEFESGGRLCIYTTGDKTRNGAGYISLYLSISDTLTLPLGWEVLANFKLFVFDQLRDRYLTVHDNSGGIRRFNNINREWGFAQLISLETFNQASNGYLVNDSCMFGAEVFVIKNSGKWECISLSKEARTTYTWKIGNFSSLPDDAQFSDAFKIGNFNWCLMVYSKGTNNGKNTHLSLYLKFLDLQSLPSKGKLFAEFALRIEDKVNGYYTQLTTEHRFDSSEETWGYAEFMPLTDLSNAERSYLIKDTMTLEVEFLAMPRVENSS